MKSDESGADIATGRSAVDAFDPSYPLGLLQQAVAIFRPTRREPGKEDEGVSWPDHAAQD